MNDKTFSSLLFGIFVSCAGCAEQQEIAVTNIDDDKFAHQQEEHQRRQADKNHLHHHRFTDPAEEAKKWNAPERDEWQYPQEILAALALEPGAMVADIGAGTGYMVAHLSNAVGRDGTIVAIDSSLPMIEYLRRRVDELGPARIIPRKVGEGDPELRIAAFDAVLTLDTWHHLNQRENYAKRVFEGLKPGGRFVVVDHDVDAESGPPQVMRRTSGQVVRELEAAGFRVEVAKESMPRHFMVVGSKK